MSDIEDELESLKRAYDVKSADLAEANRVMKKLSVYAKAHLCERSRNAGCDRCKYCSHKTPYFGGVDYDYQSCEDLRAYLADLLKPDEDWE